MSRDVFESFLPPEAMKKMALAGLSNALEGKRVGIKEFARSVLCISGYENVEELMEVLEEVGVFQNPQDMFQVAVKTLWADFSNIYDQIECQREENLNDKLGRLDRIRDNLQIAIKKSCDNESCNSKYIDKDKTKEELEELFYVLKRDISTWIGVIRGIDNQNRIEFFVRARGNIKAIDTNMRFIHLVLDALEEIVKIYCIVDTCCGGDGSRLLNTYEQFYREELLKGDTPNLLNDYDFSEKKEKVEYFLHLEDKAKDVKNIEEYYSKFLRKYKDVTEGYEDISFSK